MCRSNLIFNSIFNRSKCDMFWAILIICTENNNYSNVNETWKCLKKSGKDITIDFRNFPRFPLQVTSAQDWTSIWSISCGSLTNVTTTAHTWAVLKCLFVDLIKALLCLHFFILCIFLLPFCHLLIPTNRLFVDLNIGENDVMSCKSEGPQLVLLFFDFL